MALNVEEVQHAARAERDTLLDAARAERDLLLAEKDALHQRETLLARQKLIQNERELARLTAGYDSKIASLDVRLESVSIKNSNNFRRIKFDRQKLSRLRCLLHGVML
jgi:hypothetical protein